VGGVASPQSTPPRGYATDCSPLVVKLYEKGWLWQFAKCQYLSCSNAEI